MEKKDRLKKFSYDESTFDSVSSKLVTWNYLPVEILKIIKSTSGPRFVGVIEGDDYDQVFTWTSEGKCVEAQSSEMDLYVDTSIELWFNLCITSDGTEIIASQAYKFKEDALKARSSLHFDTVSVRTSLEKASEYLRKNSSSCSSKNSPCKVNAIFSWSRVD